MAHLAAGTVRIQSSYSCGGGSCSIESMVAKQKASASTVAGTAAVDAGKTKVGIVAATAKVQKVNWEVTLAVLQDALSDASTVQDIFKKVGRVLRVSGSQCVPHHCKGALKQAATAIAETSLDPLLADEAQEFVELLDLPGGKAQKSEVQKL